MLRRWLLVLIALAARPFAQRCTADGVPAPSRLLIIKPDHLGDVLLATPALRALRQRHPDAFIVVLVGPWSATILRHNPHINALLTLPFPGFERQNRRATLLHPYRLLLHSASLLRAGRFDTALLLRDDHWWGAALALLAGIPCRMGYAVPENQPFLTTALPWNPAQHVTTQALDLVACLAPKASSLRPTAPDTLPLTFEPPPHETAWANQWLAQQGFLPTVPTAPALVVLHPGTGGATKLWLPERWAAVGNTLLERHHLRLLITGGPGEEPLARAVADLLHTPPLMLVGTTSIGQLVALLQHAALVMGVDSGPLHLAVSQHTPTLHLFGPSNAHRFGPWGNPDRHIVLTSNLWCSPCNHFSACPRYTTPPECMEHISVEMVVHAACRLLETHSREPLQDTL
jgi:heptosyltransferase-2/heptosyltransferase-3